MVTSFIQYYPVPGGRDLQEAFKALNRLWDPSRTRPQGQCGLPRQAAAQSIQGQAGRGSEQPDLIEDASGGWEDGLGDL